MHDLAKFQEVITLIDNYYEYAKNLVIQSPT